mgnify:CR=1 FL=1
MGYGISKGEIITVNNSFAYVGENYFFGLSTGYSIVIKSNILVEGSVGYSFMKTDISEKIANINLLNWGLGIALLF